MNRYVSEGLCLDAARGKRVMVVSRNRKESHEAFLTVADRMRDSSKVYRANGRERIEHPSGGRIIFTIPDALRGHEADVVYDETRTRDASLCIAHGGELVCGY